MSKVRRSGTNESKKPKALPETRLVAVARKKGLCFG